MGEDGNRRGRREMARMSIYEGERCGMAGVAGAFIREKMKDRAYAERVESELLEVERRLTGDRVSGADVHFLKNVAVLVECALRD